MNAQKASIRFSITRTSHRAFTLTEQLTVIGILAILLAILLPSFAMVRARSRQTVCTSNLRQIGHGILMYAEDFDNRFPYGGDPADVYGGDLYIIPGGDTVIDFRPLPDVLASFVSDKNVWACPADTGYTLSGLGAPRYYFDTRPSAYDRYGSSYGYYTELAIGQYPVSTLAAVSRQPPHEARGPADIVVLSDGSGDWHGGYVFNMQRYNSLFADGHVKLLSSSDHKSVYQITLKH